MPIEPGDLVLDHLGDECIVIEAVPTPPEDWLDIQREPAMREHRAARWWRLLPLDGGAVWNPEPLIRRLRRAGEDDVLVAMDHANASALAELRASLPESVEAALRRRRERSPGGGPGAEPAHE